MTFCTDRSLLTLLMMLSCLALLAVVYVLQVHDGCSSSISPLLYLQTWAVLLRYSG